MVFHCQIASTPRPLPDNDRSHDLAYVCSDGVLALEFPTVGNHSSQREPRKRYAQHSSEETPKLLSKLATIEKMFAIFLPGYHGRETIEEYSKEVKDLSMKVLKLMGKAVGIEEEEVRSLFEEGMQSMRMNYYPPCPQPELVMGLCPHSDACALTILLQINEIEGLQIRKDGIWIPVIPLPNAFIVNVGDAFEIFSNGIYRSIEHRSVVSSEKERISVATFQSPRLDGELGPASSLINADDPPKFKKIGVAEFYKGYFTRELVGKSYVDTMRITSTEDKMI